MGSHDEDKKINTGHLSVSFLDIAQIVWHKRKVLIAVSLICAVSGILFSLFLPQRQKITVVIEPPKAGMDLQTREFRYLDNAAAVSSKINTGIYHSLISSKLENDNQKNSLKNKKIKLTALDKSQHFILSSVWPTSEIEIGKRFMFTLVDFMREEYNDNLKKQRKIFSELTAMKKNELAFVNSQIQNLQQQIEIELDRINTQEKQRENYRNLLKVMQKRHEVLLYQVGSDASLSSRTQVDKNNKTAKHSPVSEERIGVDAHGLQHMQIFEIKLSIQLTQSTLQKIEDAINESRRLIDKFNLEQHDIFHTKANKLEKEIELNLMQQLYTENIRIVQPFVISGDPKLMPTWMFGVVSGFVGFLVVLVFLVGRVLHRNHFEQSIG